MNEWINNEFGTSSLIFFKDRKINTIKNVLKMIWIGDYIGKTKMKLHFTKIKYYLEDGALLLVIAINHLVCTQNLPKN